MLIFSLLSMFCCDHKLAWTDEVLYQEIYEDSIKHPEEFWKNYINDIDWKKAPDHVYDPKSKTWLNGGKASICWNCVDRHAIANPHKKAIVWYGDEPSDRRELSYQDLQKLVIKIASILKTNGVQKNDVVAIYMPMIPESIAAMLACSRIGALHLVVFAGFSPEALSYRIQASNAKVILTTTSARRGGKEIAILKNVENAISKISNQPKVLKMDELESYDSDIDDKIDYQSSDDNLFVLYTSGSSGKPKGIIHSALPYLLYVATTFKVIFDIRPEDVYFCTSDIGWITGHSYMAYAPLFHGATLVMFEGNPTYPTADRYWEIIEKERVTIFYTAPTAIRSLQMFNKSFVKNHDLSSLRILGSVGEPLNESAWKWYFEVVGNSRCPIMDTWWQTESGGIVLAPLRNLKQEPGVAGKPFFGVETEIVDSDGNPNYTGKLVIKNEWPGLCRNVMYECEYTGHEKPGVCENKFRQEYFKDGKFQTGDGAIYTKLGNIKVIGRLDDVINISGHRLGTAEFECAINKVSGIKESAVVAINDELKGQAAFVYVVLSSDCDKTEIVQEIIKMVRKTIGPIAKPEYIAFVPELPKTRSGKIVRHLLRDIAQGKDCSEKDVSSVVNQDSIDIAKLSAKSAVFCPDVCKIKKK